MLTLLQMLNKITWYAIRSPYYIIATRGLKINGSRQHQNLHRLSPWMFRSHVKIMKILATRLGTAQKRQLFLPWLIQVVRVVSAASDSSVSLA